MKKYILIFSAIWLLTPFLARAQTALPSAGFTPESPFYFLDRFGEALQEFFTFNPEAKARLQITFAAERVAEIKIILETKGVDAKGLEVAQGRLKTHLAGAATIVTDQKAKGKDVSQLAKELDDEFEGPKTTLEETFKVKERALEAQEDELKTKIKEARQAGDTAQVEVLAKELGDVKAQKELLELKEEEQEEALEQEEEKIEREMEAKEDAEKSIREAEEKQQEIADEAIGDGISILADAFTKFDKLLAQAKDLFVKENYVGAKQLAKQAEKSLKTAEKAIENLKKEKDNEEEVKADEEGRAREAKQTREEKVKKEAKKESENLKEEQNKAEETEKADEKLRKESEKLDKEQNKAKEERTERSQTETTVVASKTWTVEYKENQFVPSEVKIKRGDTVSWINRSDNSMWPASAIHPTHQVYPGFDALRGLGAGESYSFTFDKVGSWRYHDHLNPSVTGSVIVE